MIPLRVYVENFMSYREGQELLFDNAPLWVLAGQNGAGKSTIFDAITFALYGVHRGGKQNAKDLINHQEDTLTVEFDFLVNAVAYRVRRTVPRKGKPTREVFYLLPSQTDGKSKIEPIPNTDKDAGFKQWVEQTIGLNDKAFTSCVLLLQGQSDKLLTAEPAERYEILKQLIDLSAYEQLHEKADNLHKEHEAQAKGLQRQVDSVPSVSEAELQNVRDLLSQDNNNWKTIQEKVENLTSILQQAKQWKQLNEQMSRQLTDLQELNQLRARSVEIEKKYERFQELGRVIGPLNLIIEQRDRLVKTERQIEQLQPRLQQLQNELGEVETEKKNAETQVEQLAKAIEQLQDEDTALANRIGELAPLVERLSQWESLQVKLNEREQELAKFPLNLAQTVKQAEVRDHQLAELEKVLPWLQQLAQSRSDLADALNKKQAASEQLESLDTQIQEHQDTNEQLSADIETAREKERNLSHEVTRAKTEYDAVRKRRERFEEAAHQPTCELCGQEITPEHAQRERKRLDEQFTTTQTHLNNLTLKYQQAQKHLNKLEADVKVLSQKLTILLEKRNQVENQKNQVNRDAKQFATQLNKALSNLPATYQVYVSPYLPQNDLQWLDTTYPTETDLEQLNQEVSSRKVHAKSLEKLHQQFNAWKNLDGERQTYSKELAELEEIFSLAEAQQVRSQQHNLQQVQEQLKSQIQERKKERSFTKSKAMKASETVTKLSIDLQQRQVELREDQGSKKEIQRSLQFQIESLPELWQEEAYIINIDKLKELETQRQGLAEYENLSRKLKSADESVTRIENQISNLRTQIELLPQKAQRPAEEVEQELESVKSQREKVDVNRKKAERNLNQLVERHDRRLQLEKDLQKADRDRHLYKLLSNLLGRDGLQLHLLRKAEQAIVEIANGILDSLSRGQMRLELRGEGKDSGSQFDKALDLVAYNSDTGDCPTSVALTSGSQRFRIAVCLALAIGQYAGQGARHIESVIIDEGFGTLDKNGRDDMIQELNELQQQLARIILVSHQEEFFSAFTNGYAVELVNGASKVSLLENA